MHIVLLANYLPDGQESMQRYARMLRELLERHDVSVEVLRPEPYFGRLKPSGHGFGKWLGYIDKFLIFPFKLRQRVRTLKSSGEPFLVHICDHSNAMYTRWLRNVPHLATCHDLLAIQSALGQIPEHRTGWSGRILQRWILSGLKRAAYVICVSAETRRQLVALAPNLKERSMTIDNVLNYPFAPMPHEQAMEELSHLDFGPAFHAGKFRYVLHVGGNQWYKNREGVVRIFAHLCKTYPVLVKDLSLKLVMAGQPANEKLKQLIEVEKLAEHVSFIGVITDRQLQALYSRAEVLIFPSLREGFGWPIIEAQACGCPVITSDLPPMNEIAGPAAGLAAPDRLEAFADKIAQRLMENVANKEYVKNEAIRHSMTYETHLYFPQLFNAYKEQLKSKPHGPF